MANHPRARALNEARAWSKPGPLETSIARISDVEWSLLNTIYDNELASNILPPRDLTSGVPLGRGRQLSACWLINVVVALNRGMCLRSSETNVYEKRTYHGTI